MDHLLLTSDATPITDSPLPESLLAEPVKAFPVPWAPEWQVLRTASFHGRPTLSPTATAGVGWLPRHAWPADLVLRYVAQVLQDRVAPELLHSEAFTVWAFGNGPEPAEELLALVLEGRKTATCGSVIAYEEDEEPIPRAGDLSVVTDATGTPRVLLRTTEAVVRPFGQIDAAFAYEEGEGDRSYETWRAGHERFFARDVESAGVPTTDELPVVCERFAVAGRFDS